MTIQVEGMEDAPCAPELTALMHSLVDVVGDDEHHELAGFLDLWSAN